MMGVFGILVVGLVFGWVGGMLFGPCRHIAEPAHPESRPFGVTPEPSPVFFTVDGKIKPEVLAEIHRDVLRRGPLYMAMRSRGLI